MSSNPAANRARHYAKEIDNASTPMRKLSHAFDYLRAAVRGNGPDAMQEALNEVLGLAKRLDAPR